jgi:hypothetical protein
MGRKYSWARFSFSSHISIALPQPLTLKVKVGDPIVSGPLPYYTRFGIFDVFTLSDNDACGTHS